MSWQDDARRAAREHDEREQEAADRDAAQTVDYMVRLTEQLGLRPTPGTARLGEPQPVVDGREVRLQLVRDPGESIVVELRAEVPEQGTPTVHAWVRVQHLHEWYDRGPVETLVDLGRAIDPSYMPTPPKADDEPSTGDLLLRIVQGLVRDVVADELDGRLGRGSP